jgi:uncharacterized protein YndB with AHSA1/START domain
MSPEFTVSLHIGRPPADVFEAVADPAILSRYFTTAGAVGRLETGRTVQWEFADFPGPFPVEVEEAVSPDRIVLRWKTHGEGLGNTDNRVTFVFSSVDAGTRTKVTVHETGWPDTNAGYVGSYGNCMGWAQMLCALKAWAEYGINLREGAYR